MSNKLFPEAHSKEDDDPTLVVPLIELMEGMSPPSSPSPLPSTLRRPETVSLAPAMAMPPPLPRPPASNLWKVAAAATLCLFVGALLTGYAMFSRLTAERNNLRSDVQRLNGEIGRLGLQLAAASVPRAVPTVVDEIAPPPMTDPLSDAIAEAYAPPPSPAKQAKRKQSAFADPEPESVAQVESPRDKVVTVASISPTDDSEIARLNAVLSACTAALGHKLCVKPTGQAVNPAVVVTQDGKGLTDDEAVGIYSCFRGRPEKPFIGEIGRYQRGCL